MNKTVFMRLWDIYNGLLTQTQQEITNLYFNLDLTVSEIAEEKGISRQAVSECLKTSEAQLEEYENILHFAELTNQWCLGASFQLTDALRWAEAFRSAHPEFTEDIERLVLILNKDYSEEAETVLQNPEARKTLDRHYGKRSGGNN